MYEWMDVSINEWMNVCVNELMYVCMNVWRNECMKEWMRANEINPFSSWSKQTHEVYLYFLKLLHSR